MFTMKKTIPIVLLAWMLLFTAPAARAQGPAGDWGSGISCLNLNTGSSAEVTFNFYPQGSATVAATYTDILPPGGSRNYDTADLALNVPADFSGSVVVTTTADVICTVNTQNRGDGSEQNPFRIASSSGMGEEVVSASMYAPQVMKNYSGWNSYFSVQNTTADEVTVQVTYKDRYGNDIPAATETIVLAGYSNHVSYQNANPNLPEPFLGSARIAVTQPAGARIAVLVNFYNNGADSGTSQFHSYNGMAGGATKLYMPRVVRRFYGYNSGITVQNISEVSTTMTVTFNFAGQTFTYTSGAISPYTSLVLYLPDVDVLDPVDNLPIHQRFGNAVVEVNNPEARIVGIVNEDNRGNTADNDGNPIPIERVGQGSTYSAIPAGSESKTLYFPQVMRKVNGFFSGGFYISNVTPNEGVCDVLFYNVPEAKLNDVPIGAYGSLSYYAPDIPNVPDGFNSSVTVQCTVEVIGIQNFAAEPGSGKLGDSFTQNNAFNR